jgi:hypothetical protein
MSDRVMMTVHWPDGEPTVQDVMNKHGLSADEIDAEYGVVDIDPERHEYVVLVNREAAPKLGAAPGEEYRGPFSNPKIEPFGPES